MSSLFRENSMQTSKTRRVKVIPAPVATDDTSKSPLSLPPNPPPPSPPASRSAVTSLRPILVLQALLGVGRLPVAGGTALAIIQKAYAVAIALGLIYVALAYEPQRSVLSTPEVIVHQHIATWFDLIECVVYLIVGTFANRSQLVSLLHKLDRVDRALFVEGDAECAEELRCLFTAVSVIFFNAVIASAAYWITGDVRPFAVTMICRMVRDCEVSYFISAVTAINLRLRAFERLVQPRLHAETGKATDGKDKERRRWWRPLERLVARPRSRGYLTAQQQWQVYADIVECGVNFNETISAQTLACGISSFCFVLLFVHLCLIRKQDVAPMDRFTSNSYFVTYLVVVVLRYILNHMRACAAAEHSKYTSRQINLRVHRALCDTTLEGVTRRSMESLALLTSRRPLRYTVYRIFSIDLSLPLSFFYLCVTYVIVLVQFAKL